MSTALTVVAARPASTAALARQDVQLEANVFRHLDELPSPFLDAEERIQADGVSRYELIELEDRRLVGDARFEQLRDARSREPTREVHDDAVVFASDLYPTVHDELGGKKRSSRLRPFAAA